MNAWEEKLDRVPRFVPCIPPGPALDSTARLLREHQLGASGDVTSGVFQSTSSSPIPPTSAATHPPPSLAARTLETAQ